jgi:hypothetical protein
MYAPHQLTVSGFGYLRAEIDAPEKGGDGNAPSPTCIRGGLSLFHSSIHGSASKPLGSITPRAIGMPALRAQFLIVFVVTRARLATSATSLIGSGAGGTAGRA